MLERVGMTATAPSDPEGEHHESEEERVEKAEPPLPRRLCRDGLKKQNDDRTVKKTTKAINTAVGVDTRITQRIAMSIFAWASSTYLVTRVNGCGEVRVEKEVPPEIAEAIHCGVDRGQTGWNNRTNDRRQLVSLRYPII